MKQEIEIDRKIKETKQIVTRSQTHQKKRDTLQEVSGEREEHHTDSADTKKIREYYETCTKKFNTMMK